MSPEFAAALPFIVIGLVLVLLIIWFVARSNRTTTIVDDDSAETPGSAKPTRNQALVDAPKSAEIIQGTQSANANADEVATAGEAADAEAGVSVAPTVGDPVPPRPEPEVRDARRTSASAPHPEARQGERTGPAPPATPAKPPQQADTPQTEGDDLTRMKGLGPKLAALLRDEGVTRFDQIAEWSQNDIARIDTKLGRFKGRIERDQWVEQARLLRSGDQAAFDAKFGRNA